MLVIMLGTLASTLLLLYMPYPDSIGRYSSGSTPAYLPMCASA